MVSKKVKGLLSVAIPALGIVAGHAAASGFALFEQNASGLGNSYAGQAAAAENASTIFFNPAGMPLLEGRQISGVLNIIKPSGAFTNNGGSVSPSAFIPLGDNGGDAGDWNYVPNFYLSWQFTPRIWGSISVNAPFGLKTDYDANFLGRFQSQKALVQTIDVNPSIAFKVKDWLSIGGGISYQ